MKEIARILIGSQNYGLDTPDSDKDYKIILCPEFDDFYNYHKVSLDDLPSGYDKEHNSVMSIMQFNHLLIQGNPNCLEMLFSTETKCNDPNFLYYITKARELFHNGHIAFVWDKYCSAVKGLMFNSIDRYGVNPKTISRAYYFLAMTEAIFLDDFKITVNTWRGNYSFQENSRNIRFDSEMYEKVNDVEVLKDSFEATARVSQRYATSLIENYKLTLSSAILDNLTEDIVKKYLLEEIGV